MTTKILPHERKFVKMFELVNKIVSDDIGSTVDSMVEKDPRLLCRLNLKNEEVSQAIKAKMDQGQLHPFDLMYEPEETAALVGKSRTEKSKEFSFTPEDESWFKSLEADFEERTRKIKWTKGLQKKVFDESSDDLRALV